MFIIVSQERLPWGLELPRHLPNICPIWSNSQKVMESSSERGNVADWHLRIYYVFPIWPANLSGNSQDSEYLDFYNMIHIVTI